LLLLLLFRLKGSGKWFFIMLSQAQEVVSRPASSVVLVQVERLRKWFYQAQDQAQAQEVVSGPASSVALVQVERLRKWFYQAQDQAQA
jgi:hypothetical protein